MTTQPKLIGKQCVFARHFKQRGHRKDALMVREVLHYDDGSKSPNIKMVFEPERPFYVTTPENRNHKQKKSTEVLDKVMRYNTTDSNLSTAVANALEMPYERRGMRELNKSPYLYNSDYTVANIWKRKYINKYPEVANNFLEVCNLDIETNTEFYDERKAASDSSYVNPEEIKVITLDMGDKHFLGVTTKFLGGEKDGWKEKYNKIAKEHIADELDVDSAILKEFATERELIIETFRVLHEWNPDIVAIWNML